MGKMTLQQMITQLAGGMAVSTQIFVITLLFSLPLGLVIAFGRMSKNKLIQTIVKVYISIMRGTPLMLQLMVVYFGPYYLFRIKVGSSYRLWATFIGFVINYAAYFAEIYRSGIQSMPVGQYEAAEILGYGKAQTFFKIILPQVIKRILPSVTNEVITLVKDTSLAFTLSVAEMFSIAKALAASQTNMMPFVAAAVFYYIFNLVVAVAMEWIEKGIRVNSISPGYTATPMNTRPEMVHQTREFESQTPIQRMAKVEEMAGPALFLASDAASFCTGVDLVVDGGFICW